MRSNGRAFQPVPPISFPEEKTQESRVRKSAAVPLPNDNKAERWDDIEALVAGADASDEVGRRVAAKTGVAPVLARPFRSQHVFEIKLAPVRSGPIIPPA